MSDPVSTMDVEDVLSSIRRLVSEEAKGSTDNSDQEPQSDSNAEDIFEAAETAATDAVADAARQLGIDAEEYESGTPPSNESTAAPVTFRHTPPAGRARPDQKVDLQDGQQDGQKLVLTAAFRVPEPADQPDAGDAEDDFSEGDLRSGPPTGLRKTPAADQPPARPHLRSVASGPGAEPKPEPVKNRTTPRPMPFDYAPEDTLFDRARRAMETVRPGGPARMPANAGKSADHKRRFDTASDAAKAVQPSGADSDDDISTAFLAAFGSDNTTTPEADEPALSEARPDDHRLSERAQAWLDDTGMDDDESAEFAPAMTEDDEAEAPQISPDRPAAASPFSATGGVFGRIPETVSPALHEAEVFSEPGTEQPAAFTDLPPEDEPSTINFTEEEDPFLDEETLRDMVSEMVRQELQGELGDRITRNVRKLVRREIQRALATREFE